MAIAVRVLNRMLRNLDALLASAPSTATRTGSRQTTAHRWLGRPEGRRQAILRGCIACRSVRLASGTLFARQRMGGAEALRLAVSIGSGHATASGMLQRLAAYPRQNGLAVALREIGRIERTLFTLDWIRDPGLRRRANAGLNKGEARNALARAVFFHRLGELRDRAFENQIYRASGLNLLVAAIILWNTRYLQATFDALARKGRPPSPALLRHIAPLGWEHISLTGDYIWAEGTQPAPDTLRPLREKPSMLAAWPDLTECADL